MLRKQANPEHADSAPRIPEHPAMDLDPATVPGDAPDALQGNDILDDVFGGGDDDEHFDAHADHAQGIMMTTHHHHHPSDVPRLQQEHTTAGYRDGITVAKATSIQAGFDEGFGLGATLGLHVGRLLGLLEGIAAAAQDEEAAGCSSRRLGDARAELGVKSVLGAAFWHADGTWKYEVAPSSAGDQEQEQEQLLFAHVVDAHPLVAKWTAIVRDEMQRLGLDEHDVPLLARHHDDDDDDDDDDVKAQHRQGNVLARGAKATGGSQPQGEAKAPNDALSW